MSVLTRYTALLTLSRTLCHTGVMLWATAVPAFSYATSIVASHGLLVVLPLLPVLWLLYGACICLAAVVAKKLLMPALHPMHPIQLWSCDFACWWLVHRIIAVANNTFAGHLRGTALLPYFYRALVSLNTLSPSPVRAFVVNLEQLRQLHVPSM